MLRKKRWSPVVILCALSVIFSCSAPLPLAAEEPVPPREEFSGETDLPLRSFTLFAAGDVCPAYNIGKDHWRSPGFFSTEAVALISSHHMSVMNYETSTDHKGAVPRQKKFVFRASPESPRGLNFFTAAVTANNHSFDCGEKGWESTDEALAGAGLPHNGVYGRKTGYTPFVYERGGWKIVLVTGTVWGSSLGKYATLSPEDIVRVLGKLPERGENERRIVYIHGGEEYKHKTSSQQRWSQKFAAAGADVVLWAHSHVWGPVEYEGKTLTAYGLGNFLFGGNSGWRNRKGIAGLSIRFFEDGKIEWKKVLFDAGNYRLSPSPVSAGSPAE